jgi:8-oxo-dGTP diphosphatase
MKHHAVVFALYRADGGVLMEWRDDGVFAPGNWSFPGGRIERGEQETDALLREAKEELGIDVLDAMPLEDLTYKGWRIMPYLVTRWRGDPPGATIDAGHRLQWFAIEAAAEVEWVPAVQIAKSAVSFLHYREANQAKRRAEEALQQVPF